MAAPCVAVKAKAEGLRLIVGVDAVTVRVTGIVLVVAPGALTFTDVL